MNYNFYNKGSFENFFTSWLDELDWGGASPSSVWMSNIKVNDSELKFRFNAEFEDSDGVWDLDMISNLDESFDLLKEFSSLLLDYGIVVGKDVLVDYTDDIHWGFDIKFKDMSKDEFLKKLNLTEDLKNKQEEKKLSDVKKIVNKILEGTSVREALSDTEIVNALGNMAYRESGKDMYFVLAGDPVGIDSVFVYDSEGKLSNHEFRPNEKIYCGPGDTIEIYANTELAWCYIPRSGGKDKDLGLCKGIQFKVPVKVAGIGGVLPIWLKDQGEDTEYYMLCLDMAKSWCKQITHIKPLKGY